ncbi:MAG: winged helix-turn-helix transcriptional regulator [Nitrospirae bacterium]|nr:winged helix-turn-helix transcriptional regulator [Nitrospirota bacterium]
MNKLKTDRHDDDITLRILDELSKEPHVTQRSLSGKLDVALGLVNAYMKRLAKKGYIKVTTIPQNRVKYILTPKGFTEKVRLTYEYMHFSLSYFKDIRQRIDNVYKQMISSGAKNLLLWGDGEVAELCYVSLRGLPLNLIGIIDNKRADNGFFGHNIYAPQDLAGLNYDAILITSLKDKENERQRAMDMGADTKKLFLLSKEG